MDYFESLQSGLAKLGDLNIYEESFNRSSEAFYRRRLTEPFNKLGGIFLNCTSNYIALGFKSIYDDSLNLNVYDIWRLAGIANIAYIHTKPLGHTGCSADPSSVLYSFLVGDESIIHWHRQYTVPFMDGIGTLAWCQKPYFYHHLCLMIRLAMQADWELLSYYCDYALQIEPPKNKLYKKDYVFLRALAQKDVNIMQEMLNELLKPSVLKQRQSKAGDEWDRESFFMACYPMLYYKMAQYYGFQLSVNSPWMPEIFLSKNQFSYNADVGLDFINKFDIFQPFDNSLSKDWCSNPSVFSPRRFGENPLMFRDVYKALKGVLKTPDENCWWA